MQYHLDTHLDLEPGPFACGYIAGRALCSDGKTRALRFKNGGIPDTFFSTPCSVKVKGKTVSGYATIETMLGYSKNYNGDDPEVVKFVAYTYGVNGALLPKGTIQHKCACAECYQPEAVT